MRNPRGWQGSGWGELQARDPDALAAFWRDPTGNCPPGGESFADLCARIAPALARLADGGRVTVVAHAGTVRAALALALGAVPPALAFEVAPLSATSVRLSAFWARCRA